MSIIDALRAKASPRMKKNINSIRYEIVPNFIHGMKRLIVKPKLPTNENGEVLIHLGCGNQNDERYINIDAIPLPHIHFVHDVTRLPMLPDNHADLVYACHVLEHTSYTYLVGILQEWRRVLKNGGILRISVPDFDKILDIYKLENNAIEKVEGPLMGGQNYKYNFHMSMFNKEYLSKLLRKAGFREVRVWEPSTAKYYSFADWASNLAYGKYPISLNLEAVK